MIEADYLQKLFKKYKPLKLMNIIAKWDELEQESNNVKRKRDGQAWMPYKRPDEAYLLSKLNHLKYNLLAATKSRTTVMSPVEEDRLYHALKGRVSRKNIRECNNARRQRGVSAQMGLDL